MDRDGAVVGSGAEPGNRPGRPREWLEGFLWGVGVGGGVAVCLWFLVRGARHMELVGRVNVAGGVEVIVRWWAPTG
jgi:hypothetical protein